MYSHIFELHADIFKALAHPRRLEILQLLRDQELPVSDIHTMLDLPQANISQHLTILRDAEIVSTRRDGKQMYYQLSDLRILKACDLFRDILVDRYKDSPLADEFSINMKELLPLTHDPVCQMRVSPKTAGFHAKHKGKEYYFCASGCLKKFQQGAEKYV